MWIKLTTEYINLDHIVRVRTSKTFRNGQEECAVELEGVFKGELQIFARYRGVDAEILLRAIDQQRENQESLATTMTGSQVMAATVHDVKI